MSRYPSMLAVVVLMAGCCKNEGAPSGAAGGAAPAVVENAPLPAVDPNTLPEVQAQLGVPPRAAPPTNRSSAAKVVVNLEVREVTREISDGTEYTFWTFGGTVPGPMIRVRRGDVVQLHLQNHPENTMPHNIDLHAVTGPGGGATSTFTAPGHQTQFTFRALNPGVYIYHCATAPVGMHVANGMYGIIAVEPEEGWPAVDEEYYVVQGEFYTRGDFREPGLQPFDMERAIDEDPAYVVFNGREGSLVGQRAITADVGEKVRIFVGNGGPNLISSFHVIGEIFDHVYREGGSHPDRNVQTTLVPAGGAAIVDFGVEVPGTFIIVDHSLFRTFHKGTLGMLRVNGPENHLIYSGREIDEVYLGDQSPAATALAQQGDGGAAVPGEATFLGVCSACHQRNAEGLANVFPPLASSDFLMADTERAIRVVLAGLSGPITVNGHPFNGAMPPFANLTDHEVADVLTYVRTHFGNQGAAVTTEEVAAVRASLAQPAAQGHP